MYLNHQLEVSSFQLIISGFDLVSAESRKLHESNKIKIYSYKNDKDYWVEPDLFHPLVKGGDSKAYALSTSNKLILFPYQKQNNQKSELIDEKTLKNNYPQTWQYLYENKKYLEDCQRRSRNPQLRRNNSPHPI